MSSNRNASIKAALEAQATRRGEARAQRQAKVKKVRPWELLKEQWHEEDLQVFGIHVNRAKWGPAESRLARKLLTEEVDLEKATQMVKVYMADTKARGRIPSFRYFWTIRDTLKATVEGKVQTRKERMNSDEFKPEEAKKYPKVGW